MKRNAIQDAFVNVYDLSSLCVCVSVRERERERAVRTFLCNFLL